MAKWAPRTGMRWALLTLATGLLGVLSASCGGPNPMGGTCEDTSDCSGGRVCVDGTCMALPDSGPTPDTGPPEEECFDGDSDGFQGNSPTCPSGTDCNDGDRNIHPAASEVCGTGVDENCNGATDEDGCVCTRGQSIACYTGDPATRRVGACRNGVAVCVEDGVAGDCNGEILPSEETCDGEDNDCDGTTDEGVRNACGECSDTTPMEACGDEVDNDCDGMTDESCNCDYRCVCPPDNPDCTCVPPTNQPCYEGPVGTDGRGLCVGGRRDCVDPGDGSDPAWGTCVGQVTPATECEGGATDGEDNDCDGRVDEGCRDGDGDGSPWPADCNDDDSSIAPGAAEVCDGMDQDCDGVSDEGVTNACGYCGTPAATETCDNGEDDDCNGFVDDTCGCALGATQACYGGPSGTIGVGACTGGTQTCEGTAEFPGWSACAGQIIPAPEFCDGQDNDCDGEVDERWAAGSNACGFCDGAEVCDGMDQDCDGLTDEGVSNACGECGPEPVEVCDGVDNDCDGVTDEGVVNACGTCPPEPCFDITWGMPADCTAPGRTCGDVIEHPDHPGGITLDQTTFDSDYIYIAVTARNEVVQMNTDTGAVNWVAPSHGRYPSRTAVAVDGSVWVGNRAYTGSNPADVNQSNVVHLSEVDGSLICRAPVLNIARSVAIDGLGNVWAGSFNTGTLYHISGSMVDTSTSPPTCVVLNTIETGQNIYGVTVDPDGYVWTSSSPTVRINSADYSMMNVTNPSHYGLAPDGMNRIWFGGWRNSGNVHAIDRTSFAITDTGVNQITAVTVHPDGTIWGSSYGTNEVVGFNTDGSVRCRAPVGAGSNPHGVAVDRMGRIWMPSRFGSGTVSVYDTSCVLQASYNVSPGNELYSYSDMTGHLLRTFTSPEGNWDQIFDSGYAMPYWSSISWNSIEPPDTGVEMTVRSADTIAGLDAGTSCGPFTTSPADLSGCPADLHRHRYLRVEARLFRAGSTDERPVLTDVTASWAY